MMTGYELYSLYQAVKLHFTSDKYDFFKYHGKTRTTVESFERRKDKYMFHKLSRKVNDAEAVEFLVANFIMDVHNWSRSLIQDGAKENHVQWQKRMQSLSYTFEQDIVKILEEGDINAVMKIPEDGSYPTVLTMVMRGEVSMETLAILNSLTNCLTRWEKGITDTVMFPRVVMRIRKYTPFIPFDSEAMKKIVQKHLTA